MLSEPGLSVPLCQSPTSSTPLRAFLLPALHGHIPFCCAEDLGTVGRQGTPPLRLHSWLSALPLAFRFLFSLSLSPVLGRAGYESFYDGGLLLTNSPQVISAVPSLTQKQLLEEWLPGSILRGQDGRGQRPKEGHVEGLCSLREQ